MKGAELPINTLIIIVIALVILIAVIAIFFGVYNPSKEGINLEAAKSNACQMLASMNCGVSPASIIINNFDADKDGTVGDIGTWTWGDSCSPSPAADGDNLASLCACQYSINTNDADCRKTVCGCTS